MTVEGNKLYKNCVSRISHNNLAQNEAPPTFSRTQLEASHELIVASVVETETEPQQQKQKRTSEKKLQQVIRVKFVAAFKGRDKPIHIFVQKRESEEVTDTTLGTIYM